MVLAFSGLSLAKYVTSSPALMRFLKPVADAYARAAGYRKMGLRYDDLLIEENDTAQKAISRLSERETYDRAFRLRQATQLSVLHRQLPKEQWVTPQEDRRYLNPLIEELRTEEQERAAWDTVKVKKDKH
ncbi:putative ubiquinol--cytochrome-c reductase [Microstroma glucosiphilum]|uniref:Cytochrome b-c1 complex subunit 7 n=1 Tax=Pseudomicrostroma glucosiphilum TaxID=1684307 RepID=A0A316TYR6_9BASI|nr:putative ubiquinol--cytochrome-c reductase [Pseudomicrostroma glucosiphilum]PWN17854.1 putative ubiquinol--cytochrome-c reductase [Pseudomicrostroma glucosiphilum]